MQVSHEYLQRARSLIEEAQRGLERLDYALCLIRSAESVEFSLKAALLAMGESHELKHDVSDDLYQTYPTFPDWFKEKVPRYILISKTLTVMSLPAKYGDQKLRIPPRQMIQLPEATAYIEIARDVQANCERLYWEARRATGST